MPPRGRAFDFLDEFARIKDRVRRLELRFNDPMMDKGGGGEGYVISYSIPGELTTSTGQLRWYPPSDGVAVAVSMSLGTAPSGSNVTIRLMLNSSIVHTMSISSGAHYNIDSGFSPIAYSGAGSNYFTVDVTAVGSSVPGSDLVVELRIQDTK